MGKTNNKSEKDLDARRKAKREAERRRRERIKSNPQLYEESKQKDRERWHNRKQEGKVKLINEISVRSQRAKRKTWKIAAKKYRMSKKKENVLMNTMLDNSPPPSPDQTPVFDDIGLHNLQNHNNQRTRSSKDMFNSNGKDHDDGRVLTSGGSSRKGSGRKKVRKDRASAYRKVKRLELELKKYKSRYNKYKSKYYREINQKQKNKDSPNTKVKCMTKGLQLSKCVKRRLIFNEALISQIQYNYKNICKNDQKRNFRNCIAGKILKKYKCLHEAKQCFSFKLIKRGDNLIKYNTLINENIQNEITSFLEEDSCSTLCPGKKDTVTQKKCKKQKRYLNDSLKNLYKVFCDRFTQFNVSYSTFCKLRPFWIVQRKVFNRDTCLCMSHENMKFMVSKLKNIKVIFESTSTQLLKSICCPESKDLNKCLERRCEECKNKQLKFFDFCKEDTVSFHKWVLKNEEYVIKGKTKTSKKYFKELLKCTIGDLVEELKTSIPSFMKHVSNIIHQHKVIKKKKDELQSNEVMIHMDFSENYECKYSEEIQAFHFGGSREQISIHTVMLYYKKEESDATCSKAFSTLSNNLNHDAMAICAHLKPVLDIIIKVVPNLTKVHFVSDGPNNQYRNRKMFYLIATYLPSILPSVEIISWNYSEAGHGKGAPDGLGGTIKRTADTMVAQGQDIQDFDKMVSVLQDNIKNITIISVSKSDIQSFTENINDYSETFKGTMKVHQVLWRKTNSDEIEFRRLSCFSCPLKNECCHYGMGIQILMNKAGTSWNKSTSSKTLTYSSVYSDSDDDNVDSSDLSTEPPNTDSLVNAYVVAKFKGNKSIHHYVGVITEENNCDGRMSYFGQFMRKNSDGSFSFPSQIDQCFIDLGDIVQVLKEPTLTRRQTYLFQDLNVNLFANLK